MAVDSSQLLETNELPYRDAGRAESQTERDDCVAKTKRPS